MIEDRQWPRIKELQDTIAKAKRELKGLETPKSFHEDIQEELDAFEAERASGDNYEDKGYSLGNTIAAALNMMHERLQGQVIVHGSEEVTVFTDVGNLRYNGDEWFFLENQ